MAGSLRQRVARRADLARNAPDGSGGACTRGGVRTDAGNSVPTFSPLKMREMLARSYPDATHVCTPPFAATLRAGGDAGKVMGAWMRAKPAAPSKHALVVRGRCGGAHRAAEIFDAIPPRPMVLFSPIVTLMSGVQTSMRFAPGWSGGLSNTPSTCRARRARRRTGWGRVRV